MKKKIIFLLLSIFAFVGIINPVYAEGEECKSTEYNSLVKEASKVTGAIEFTYNEINEVNGFDYVMYVSYTGLPSQKEDIYTDSTVLEVDRDTGIGRLHDDNIKDIYKVYFSVFSLTSSCKVKLKQISITKLQYNKYSELEQCNISGMEDYMYCKQWIDQKINIKEGLVIEKIKNQAEKIKDKTTSVCFSCIENQRNDDIYNNIVKVRKYAIIGLSIGVAIDLLFIIINIKKVRESRL